MKQATTSGVGFRALREFGPALRSGPFRVALVLSLIVHLALMVAIGRGGPERQGAGERRIPLMRVRLLSPGPAPAAVPVVPANNPAVRQPRREKPGRQAAAALPQQPAAAPPQRPAPAPPTPEAQVAPITPAPALVQTAEMTVREEPRGQQAPEADVPAAVAALPQATFAAAVGERGTAAVAPLPVPAPAASGSGGYPAAAQEREGREATGPEPRELASVRRRIDAHKVYPQIAVRNGWQGRVLVEMSLEGDGRLSAVRLLEGSGHAVLDDATITAVQRAAPFPPIAGVLTVPVEYRLR